MADLSALDRWQGRIDLYRAQQDRKGPPLWEKEHGRYSRWVEGNDYHRQVLPYLIRDLAQGDKVLEIGPGIGSMTIPLAEAGADILCLEPSRMMRDSLDAKLLEKGLENVEILPEKVEDVLDIIQDRASFRITLASFSLYNIREIDRVMEVLLACSQQIIVLLGTGVRSPWYQDLVVEFAPEEPIIAPQIDLLYPLLLEKGWIANLRLIEASQNYLYANEEDMVNSWMDRLNSPAAKRESLNRALRELAETRNGVLGIYRSRPVALLTLQGQKEIPKRDLSIRVN